MAQYHDGTETELPAMVEAGAYECRPDAFALMFWGNGHRREADDPERGMAGERNRRKHDVPHDCTVVLCDQRDEWLRMFAQSINKIGFGWRLERGYVHSMDSSPISMFFGSDQHVPSQDV